METLAFACFSDFLYDGVAADDWMDFAEKANPDMGPLNVDQSLKDENPATFQCHIFRT